MKTLSYSAQLWEREQGEKRTPSRGPRRSGADLPTRERIIEAATRVFLRNGYRNSTISEVVERVGVSKASFYYFDNFER